MFKALIELFTAKRQNAKLNKQLAQARLDLFNALEAKKALSAEVEHIKQHKNFLGAIPKEVYEKKVFHRIGHSNLSSNESAEFKLGIQFALRTVEAELVQG
ncbi:hypothetical protein IPa2_00026 [Pseudomonas phage vB_PpuP-IPa-2]